MAAAFTVHVQLLRKDPLWLSDVSYILINIISSVHTMHLSILSSDPQSVCTFFSLTDIS